MRDINLIVIHCSASINGRRVTAADIDQWHKDRGFRRNPALIGANAPSLKSIGYHYIIYANGPVTTGRGELEPGAHVTGFNANSIGICMVGTNQFSPEQWLSLRTRVKSLREKYPLAKVVGHRDLSPDQNKNGIVEKFEWLKICPGFDVAEWIKRGYSPLPENVIGGGE